MSTIRAYNQQAIFTAQNTHRIDRNQMCYLPSTTVNRWLAVRLEFAGSIIILCTAILAVAALMTSNVDAGLVGMVLSYALNTTGALVSPLPYFCVRVAERVVERIGSCVRQARWSKMSSAWSESRITRTICLRRHLANCWIAGHPRAGLVLARLSSGGSILVGVFRWRHSCRVQRVFDEVSTRAGFGVEGDFADHRVYLTFGASDQFPDVALIRNQRRRSVSLEGRALESRR